VNILLVKKFSSNSIFRVALVVQVIGTLLFLAMAYGGLVNLYSATAMFFVCLTCIGLINPNASALALAPFTRNVGSASALLACIQIGIAALASGGIGAFNSRSMFPVLMLMSVTCIVAVLVYFIGIRKQRTTLITGTASPENAVH
jgi:DHA1 family bicyclomycin/chloramphenicol resistance-like MFS transporter